MKFTIALKDFSEEDTDATEFTVEAENSVEAMRNLLLTAADNMTEEARSEACFWLAVVEPASEACLYCGLFYDDSVVLINRKTVARFGAMTRDAKSQYPELFGDSKDKEVETEPTPKAKTKAAQC